MSTNNETFDWKKHIANLRATKAVNDAAIREASMFTHNNIGLESGQMRPGKLGQWDVYYSVNLPENERILVSGLTPAEIAHENERQATIDEHGLDPDDPNQADALAFERDFDMQLEMQFPNIDERIAFLESYL